MLGGVWTQFHSGPGVWLSRLYVRTSVLVSVSGELPASQPFVSLSLFLSLAYSELGWGQLQPPFGPQWSPVPRGLLITAYLRLDGGLFPPGTRSVLLTCFVLCCECLQRHLHLVTVSLMHDACLDAVVNPPVCRALVASCACGLAARQPVCLGSLTPGIGCGCAPGVIDELSLRHGVLKMFWHPQRGMRIGEAKVPGPLTVSPLRRLRRKSSLSGPSLETENTELDSEGERSAENVNTPPMEPIQVEDGEVGGDERALVPQDAALQPAQDIVRSNPLKLTLAAGGQYDLSCTYIPSVRSWRWQLGPRSLRMIKESRQGKRVALECWAKGNSKKLTEDSALLVTDLIAELNNDPEVDVAIPQRPVQEPPRSQETRYVVPIAASCEHILRVTPTELLAKDVITQHVLPKSARHEVANAINWLHQLRLDESQPSCIRDTAALFICIAPRLLWPMPKKEVGERLAAHAKPRLVLARLDLLTSGRWLDLIHLTLPHAEDVEEEAARPPLPPGLLTPAQLRLIEKATQQGRLAIAWRQLWSHGKAPASEDGAYKMEQKLQGPVGARAEPALAPAQKASLRECMSDKVLAHVLKTFKPGKAQDGLGWTQQVWQDLYALPHAKLALRRFVEDLWATDLPPGVMAAACVYRAVGLFKNAEADLRPICIPTVWRKCVSTAASFIWNAKMREHIGHDQYGVGAACGVTAMASTVMTLMDEHPDWHFVQLDISNAFPSLSKTKVYHALEAVDPMLALSQQWWTQHAHDVLVPCGLARRRLFRQAGGVPQGDAMASWSFAAVLTEAQAALKARLLEHDIRPGTHYHMVSYLDDIVLAVHGEHARVVYPEWKAVLDEYGLKLQDEKTRVHTPTGASAQTLELAGLPPYAMEGLVLCGLPTVTDPTSDRPDLPVGTREFIAAWLRARLDQFKNRARVLVHLAEASPKHGQHLALHLLRVSAQARHFHVLSSIAGDLIDTWATDMSQVMWNCVVDIMGWPAMTPPTRDILSLPMTHGGLGFLDLSVEGPLLYFTRRVLLRQAGSSSMGQAKPWTDMETWAIERLTGLMDCTPWAVLKMSEDDLRSQGHRHAVKAWRGTIYARRIPPQWGGPVAAYQQPTKVQCQGKELTYTALNYLSLLWWCAPGKSFLENGILDLALRSRLNLPLHRPDATCQHYRAPRSAICGQPLDSESIHANKCCHASVTLRHNSLRDCLILLARQAGWAASPEQMIKCAGSDTRHKCDALLLQTSGRVLAVEVSVTSFVRSTPAAADLHKVCREKAARYGMYHGSRRLPHGETLVPFVVHSLAAWATEAWELCFQLSAAIADKQESGRHESWPLELQRAKQHVIATIQRCLLKGQWRVVKQADNERPG